MPTLRITDKHGELHEVEVATGDTLWDACLSAGVELPHSCLSGSTRIITEKGIQQISETTSELNTLSEEGIVCFKGLLNQGEKKTISLRTRTGAIISLTPDHLLRIWTGNTLEWCKAGDLALGSRILAVKGDGGLIPASRGISTEVWTILGHLYGDGYRILMKVESIYTFNLMKRKKV